MKQIIYIFLCLFMGSFLCAQTKLSPVKSKYVSTGLSYRSYGKGDQLGIGYQIEASKELQHWLGLSVNLSFFEDAYVSWNFFDPFAGQQYVYQNRITHFKILPSVQLIPLNTQYVDFYIGAGIHVGYFRHFFYTGGYSIQRNPNQFIMYVRDDGFKGVNYGYEISLNLRFKFKRLFIRPKISVFRDHTGEGASTINLSAGIVF